MNPYQILQVSETASADVIRAAWAVLIKDCHPDAPKPDEARARKLNEAYAVLKDPAKRNQLDQSLSATRKSAQRARPEHPHMAPIVTPYDSYPDPYPGISQEEIDGAIRDMFANAPPIIRVAVGAIQQAAAWRRR